MNKKDVIEWFKSMKNSPEEKREALKEVADWWNSVQNESDDELDEFIDEISDYDPEFVNKQIKQEQEEIKFWQNVKDYLNKLSKNEELAEIRKQWFIEPKFRIINFDEDTVTFECSLHKLPDFVENHYYAAENNKRWSITVPISEGNEILTQNVGALVQQFVKIS